MKITQVPKTMEYFLSHVSEGKLQFLKYEDFPTKNGTNKVRRLISTSDAQNKNFIQVENMINDPNYALIELEI